MSFPAPFDQYRGEVLPEWIDANNHMNLAYYTVLFDYATDALFDAIGIGRQYKDSTNHGTFAVETHNLYERELMLGDRVRIATQILGMDRKLRDVEVLPEAEAATLLALASPPPLVEDAREAAE